MSKINFIIGGVQKAGTELISYHLRGHPEIMMPENELHYFDTEISNNDLNYKKYHKNFKDMKSKKFYGEKTPIYIFYKDCMEKIANYNNHIKIILIFRDPFERALSAYNMECIRGNEKMSFDDAIKNEKKRIDFSDQNLRNFSYLSRGYYFQQLQNCYSSFPKDQILILNFDDLMSSFNKLMNSIHNFLGCEKKKFTQKPERVTWLKKKKEYFL